MQPAALTALADVRPSFSRKAIAQITPPRSAGRLYRLAQPEHDLSPCNTPATTLQHRFPSVTPVLGRAQKGGTEDMQSDFGQSDVEAAYRRLAAAILSVDIDSLTRELRAHKQQRVERDICLDLSGGRHDAGFLLHEPVRSRPTR
ncbi:MAG: hypothetical protein NVSMB2_04170 [Chloroflexota bacterium]